MSRFTSGIRVFLALFAATGCVGGHRVGPAVKMSVAEELREMALMEAADGKNLQLLKAALDSYVESVEVQKELAAERAQLLEILKGFPDDFRDEEQIAQIESYLRWFEGEQKEVQEFIKFRASLQ